MTIQVGLLWEAFPTLHTGEWLLLGVDTSMVLKFQIGLEGFPAFQARLCVKVPMSGKGRPRFETLPALSAGKWTLVGVALPMHEEHSGEGEAFPALLARICPLTGVGSLVFDKGVLPVEALSALGAGKGCLARVELEVPIEVGFLHKRLAALGAGERPLAGVIAQVLDQHALVHEAFAAN